MGVSPNAQGTIPHSRYLCRVVSFLAAFALENYRVPDVATIVVATTSWAISAALLALCLHTIWEGGGISIREKIREVGQMAVTLLKQPWHLFQRIKAWERSFPERANVDSAGVAAIQSFELSSRVAV